LIFVRNGILPLFPENSAIHGLTPSGLKFSGKQGIAELLQSFALAQFIELIARKQKPRNFFKVAGFLFFSL